MHSEHVLPDAKERRSTAFALRQAVEHEEAMARKARSALEKMRDLEKRMSAAHEAAVHCVPAQPTLAQLFERATV